MKNLFNLLVLLMFNNKGEVGALGDEGDVGGSEGDPTPPGDGGNDGGEPPANNDPSIYGDLAVEWPEGFSDDLKNEPSLKPFVNKEGKINTASLLKSFHDTKKLVGKNGEQLPDESFDADRMKQFWGKLGAKEDAEAYNVELPEGTLLEEKFVNDMKAFSAENNIPEGITQKMATFMEAQSEAAKTAGEEAFNNQIQSNLEGVRKEYGAAYDNNITLAKRVINEVGGLSAEDKKMFSDPTIGSNPAVMKVLVNIGKQLFKEDGISGGGNAGLLSPEQAQEEINKIYDDKSHAFHNPSAAGHSDAQKKMLKLFNMKQGIA